jgi:N-methylhydantoinase B
MPRSVFDENMLKMMGLNVRVPHQNWGDLNAQIASKSIGIRKVKEIVERFGKELFRQGMVDLMDYTEATV